MNARKNDASGTQWAPLMPSFYGGYKNRYNTVQGDEKEKGIRIGFEIMTSEIEEIRLEGKL